MTGQLKEALRKAKTPLVWTFVLGIFAIIGFSLWRNWSEIPFERLTFRLPYLVLSLACFVVAFTLLSLGWKYNLRSLGGHIALIHSLEILALARLGRYMPGKIWFVLGRAYFAAKRGIPEKKAAVSIALDVATILVSACLTFLALAGFVAKSVLPVSAHYLAGAALLGLVFIHPAIFSRIVNLALKGLKRPPLELSLRPVNILVLLLTYCTVWLLQGAGFYFLVNSFYPLPLQLGPAFVAIYALAWLLGFASLAFPAGLGVREGVLSLFLKFYLPVSLGIIAALLIRMWVTLIEVVFFLVFMRRLGYYAK